MVTDDARMLALASRQRAGAVGHRAWPTTAQHYGATSAPLVVGDLRGLRRLGWRRGRARFRRRLRRGHRPRGLAVLDGAGARRTWFGDLAGHGHRPSVRRDVADRVLRRRSRSVALDDGQPVPRLQRRRAPRRQPVVELGARARSDAPVACAGTSSSRRTTSTTGMRCRPSLPSMRRSRASHAQACSSRPIATASSTCSIAKRASRCSPRRSSAT